ncbi:MAG: hypothetical protein U5L96_05175 [Owenweeksia sp.]|nr:hypothetical protein [Owenweeksia sp.]
MKRMTACLKYAFCTNWNWVISRRIFDLIDENSEHLEVLQCRGSFIELDKPEPFQVDGELKGKTQKIKVKVLPGAVQLLTP